eukprot:TRINITY_DN18569_c0_g1_i1.p1 TRINITY_DN18569_c0_g1~~TRINITY_DN18569_c0_g1_i1.p1  ORF type:complete len:112 (-),score=35.44 TRINITY_DN18569_c0_g1_i1:180-494(-)
MAAKGFLIIVGDMAAKGFLIIVGDRCRLMDGSLGVHDKHNVFQYAGINVNTILGPDKEEELNEVLMPCFLMDKALVIDGNGDILANKWTVTDLKKGITSDGTKL